MDQISYILNYECMHSERNYSINLNLGAWLLPSGSFVDPMFVCRTAIYFNEMYNEIVSF